MDNLYDVWNSGQLSSHGSIHGTLYAYLVSLQESSGVQSDHTVDVLTCVWFNGLTASSSSSDFHSLMVGVPDAVTLKLRAPQDETPKLAALGQGPARFPTVNVFGDWLVESISVDSSRFKSKGVPYNDPCTSLPDNPVPPDQLNAQPMSFYPNHFPTLDPSPGWPAGQQ
ncbi:hypothetical protein ACFXHA_24800 [Nocardia sp. NPDC059240]|uniref:hypothetical protein n=1 Tax=Nocardia sp. NPDC059240 TaxID=3346786 RepID=UPI0036A8343F